MKLRACAVMATIVALVAQLSLGAPTLQALWRTTGVSATPSQAVLSVDGGRLFFGANDGNVYALSAVNGSVLWVASIASSVAGVCIDGSGLYVYAATSGGTVASISTSDGALVWSITNAKSVDVNTALACDSEAGLVYMGGGLQAITMANGTIAWQHDPSISYSSGTHGPTIAHLGVGGREHCVIEGLSSGNTYEGMLLQVFPNGTRICGYYVTDVSYLNKFVVVSPSMIVASGIEGLTVLKASSFGNWNTDVLSLAGGSTSHANAALLRRDTVITGRDSGDIFAVSPADGKVQWAARTIGGKAVTCTPTVVPGAAFVTDSAGHVSVLSASTGTLLATYNATTAPPSWAVFPASKDGSVVYYVSKGEISALTLRSPPTPSPLPPPVPTPAPTSPSTASVVESRCLHLNCTACTVVTSPVGCRSLPSAKRSVRYSCLAGDLLEVSTFDSSTTCTGIPTRTSVFPPDVCNLEAAGSFIVRRCH